MNTQLSILTVDAHNIKLAYGTKTETLKLPSNVVSRLEVRDVSQLQMLLQEWLGTFSSVTGSLLVVFDSSQVFEKTFPYSPDQQKEIERFLHSVPLERVLSRTYAVGASVVASAVNGELYDIVRESLTRAGFDIVAMVPASRLKGIPDTKPSEALRSLSLVYVPRTLASLRKRETKLVEEQKTLIIIGFVVFFIALVGLTALALRLEQPTPKKATMSQEAAVVRPTVVPSPTPTALPLESITKVTVTIQILSGPKNQDRATGLQTALMKAGYPETVIGASTRFGSALMTVDSRIPVPILSDLTDQVRKIIGKPSVSTVPAPQGSLVVIDLSI